MSIFSSAPPLERHARDSGHVMEWFCDEEECEMAGKPFATYRLYLEHFLQASAHQDEADAQDILDALGAADVLATAQAQQDANIPSSLVTSDLYVCREPCCRRYGSNYRCKSEYNRHADAPCHISASKLNQILVDSMQSGPALAAEQDAIRNLRCNAPGCLSFGYTFPTAKGFFGHVAKLYHRQAWLVVARASFPDEQEESPQLPGISLDTGGTSGTCVNERCPKVGMVFNTPNKMKQHVHSFGHAMTEEDMASSDECSEDLVWVSSEFEGMEVCRDKAVWRCVKRGCRGFGTTRPTKYKARSHSKSITHATADQDAAGTPGTPMTPFATPKSAPSKILLTPMNPGTIIPATPLSPSAGRGPSSALAMTTSTKAASSLHTPPSRTMIKIRRSYTSNSEIKQRQDELERRNHELEDRVGRLEEQLARVLGTGATDEDVMDEGVNEGGNKQVDDLY
ncbi:hypothetical protein ACHAPT_006215 [Fusarium lateritium]